MGAFVNKGLTMHTGQTHVHCYIEPLLRKIEEGEVDPSFVITHRVKLEDALELYKTFRDMKTDVLRSCRSPNHKSDLCAEKYIA